MNYFVLYRSLLRTVKTLSIAACVALLLLGAQTTQAQTDNDYDSVSVVAPAVVDEEVTDEDYQAYAPPQPASLRQVPDSVVAAMQRDKEYAYANDPEYWLKKAPPERPLTEDELNEKPRKSFWDGFFSGNGVRPVVYGLLILFFLFVIYRLIVVNNLFLFSSRNTKANFEGEISDIEDDNLDARIQHAVNANDHRHAVRFMYLKALQILNDRQWIRYHADATNYSYVNQMSGRKQAKEFTFLTQVYDYVWYGEFALTAEQFDLIYKNFSNFYNAVNP